MFRTSQTFTSLMCHLKSEFDVRITQCFPESWILINIFEFEFLKGIAEILMINCCVPLCKFSQISLRTKSWEPLIGNGTITFIIENETLEKCTWSYHPSRVCVVGSIQNEDGVNIERGNVKNVYIKFRIENWRFKKTRSLRKFQKRPKFLCFVVRYEDLRKDGGFIMFPI